MPNRHGSDVSDDYDYGFNGMMKDNEIKGNGNSYDYGARMLDPRIGRWLSVDPLEAKYTALSPYNFVANSPLKFIDPNGEEIKIVGSWFYRVVTMHRLRKLTDDKIRYNSKTKSVYIHKCSSTGKKEAGTDMLRPLIEETSKIVYIANQKEFVDLTVSNLKEFMGEEAYNSEEYAELNINYTKAMESMSQDYASYTPFPTGMESDRNNGNGAPVSFISQPLFGSESLKSLENEDGSKGGTPSIGLGHEVRHSFLNIFGLLEKNDLKFVTVRVKNTKGEIIGEYPSNKHEIEVRKFENILRKENGKVNRLIPYDASEEIELEEMEEMEEIPNE